LLVRCDVVIDGGIRFSLVGKLNVLTDDGFGISTANESSWILLPFESIEYYVYGDARTANPEHKDFIAKTYEGILSFKTPFALITVGELK